MSYVEFRDLTSAPHPRGIIRPFFSLGICRESLIIDERPPRHEVPEFSLGRIIIGGIKIQLVDRNRVPDPLKLTFVLLLSNGL